MKLVKCPKCELNYLRPGEEYCEICLKDMKKRKSAEEPESIICPECGENMAIKGQELCMACLIEKRQLDKAERLENASQTDDDDNILEIDSIVNSSDMPDEEIAEGLIPTEADLKVEEEEALEEMEDMEFDEAEAF